jgi:Xaa-Pro aminopeptidase
VFKNSWCRRWLFFVLPVLFIIDLPLIAQRTGYSVEEFVKRRNALIEKAGNGMIILFGSPVSPPGVHFRQDNDFYYFTGVNETNAMAVLIPETKKSYLFLPQQTPREEMIDGPNLLKDPKAKEKTGFDDVYSVSYLDEFIARNSSGGDLVFHMRLSPGDVVDNARWETGIFEGRKNRNHYNDQISLDNYRIKKLKNRYPSYRFEDITDHIDVMRVIKTPEEIEVLRRNGKISAEAVKQAMLASRPGGFEYEVEAAAMYEILKNGCRGFAYPPIVGSGPNSCIWHYSENCRQMEDGDIILMDFGGDLDHQCMDISRTWPVSGKFTKEQREAYQVALEVQKACIEAYRPGVTAKDVQEHVAKVMQQKGIDPLGLTGGIGHYVGMATHDVGPRGVPLQEGMVFAIEPGLYYSEKELGIRIEDTVLITADGCEVLTKDVPKEIDDIEAMLAQRNIK